MSESIDGPSPERIDASVRSPEAVEESAVVQMLERHGAYHEETRALVLRYADQCQAAAEASTDISNRANVICALQMARIYTQVPRYREAAQESLLDLWEVAYQTEDTRDLAREIDTLLDSLQPLATDDQ